MRKFNILVDVDDVIIDNLDSMKAIISDIVGYEYTEPLLNWDFTEFDRETASKIKQRIFTDELFKYSRLDTDAIHYINKLKNQGHNIYFVTAIIEELRETRKEQIREWFGEWGVKRLIVTEHKHLFKGDILIDDGPHNIKKSLCGCNIIRATDWNNSDELVEYGVRLQNWHEIYSLIESKATEYEFFSLKEAWEYLNNHSIFGSIGFKNAISYDIKFNTEHSETEFELRCSIKGMEDIECVAETFEQAIITLANLIKSKHIENDTIATWEM